MAERVEISKKLVLVNSAATMGTRLISLSVFFWLQQYLLRRIDPEELKAYYVVQAVQLYIPMLATFVVSGLARYVTESYAEGNDRKVTQIVSSMMPLNFVTALAMGLLSGLVIWHFEFLTAVAPDQENKARLMFGILMGIICARVITMPFSVGVIVKQRFVWSNVVGLISELIRIGTLFFLLFRVSTSVVWMIVAMIPAAIFDITAGVIYSRRLIPAIRFKMSEFRWDLIKPIISFGGWTFVGRLMAVVRETVGALSLSHYARPVDVVSFRTGSLVETKLFPTILAPLPTIMPALTAMHVARQETRLRNYYYKVGRYLGWAFLMAGVPLIIFRNPFWFVYLGPEKFEEYSAVGTVMFLLLIKSFVTFPQPVMAQVALAKARQREAQSRVLVIEGCAVALILFLVLGLGWGATGAALGTMVVTLVGAPLLHWTLGLRLVGARFKDWFRKTVVPVFIPALIALPVWLLAQNRLDFTGPLMGSLFRTCGWLIFWARLFVAFLPGAIVYLTVLWFLLRPDEKGDVRTIISRLSARIRPAAA